MHACYTPAPLPGAGDTAEPKAKSAFSPPPPPFPLRGLCSGGICSLGQCHLVLFLCGERVVAEMLVGSAPISGLCHLCRPVSPPTLAVLSQPADPSAGRWGTRDSSSLPGPPVPHVPTTGPGTAAVSVPPEPWAPSPLALVWPDSAFCSPVCLGVTPLHHLESGLPAAGAACTVSAEAMQGGREPRAELAFLPGAWSTAVLGWPDQGPPPSELAQELSN